jgi:hypothetical protein
LLGLHTEPVLQEVLGLGASGMARLRDDDIVAGADRDPFLDVAE